MTAAYHEWLIKADADLGAATALMRQRKTRYHDQVCFLCQQSVEKRLKAFLTANDVPFPKIHHLLQLNDLCSTVDARFATFSDGLTQLDLYAVEIRYPGTEATLDDARSSLRTARRLRALIAPKLAAMDQARLL
jgi:HEPN domain-containing protein